MYAGESIMVLVRYVGFVVISFLLVSEVLLATQLYPQFSPNTISKNDVLNGADMTRITPNAEVSVMNSSYQIENGLLVLSAQRQQTLGVSIYDVSFDVEFPLRTDLMLSYSIFSSDMDLSASSVYVYLTLANATDIIVLGYQVGQVEQGRLPEPTAPSSWYAFYQVGNETDVWVSGERNIYQDIIDKGIRADAEGWRVSKLAFGVWSFSDPSLRCMFNLNETSLSYNNTISTEVVSTPPLFSQTVAAAMVIVAFLMLLTIMVVYRKGKPIPISTPTNIRKEKAVPPYGL
jgi:hypothetical protein